MVRRWPYRRFLRTLMHLLHNLSVKLENDIWMICAGFWAVHNIAPHHHDNKSMPSAFIPTYTVCSIHVHHIHNDVVVYLENRLLTWITKFFGWCFYEYTPVEVIYPNLKVISNSSCSSQDTKQTFCVLWCGHSQVQPKEVNSIQATHWLVYTVVHSDTSHTHCLVCRVHSVLAAHWLVYCMVSSLY